VRPWVPSQLSERKKKTKQNKTKNPLHTFNSLFKNDLLEPVILSLPGFQLQKEKK
jgi:hypothetical protein